MIVVLGAAPLVRKGEVRRDLMLAAGVNARIVRAADRRVRLAVTVVGVGADLDLLRDVVGAVLVDAWIVAPTDRGVGCVT